MSKTFLILGAINAFYASHWVLLCAWPETPESMLAVYQTGVQYHFYHAFGILSSACCCTISQVPPIPIAGWLMLAGIVLFSLSLYN